MNKAKSYMSCLSARAINFVQSLAWTLHEIHPSSIICLFHEGTQCLGEPLLNHVLTALSVSEGDSSLTAHTATHIHSGVPDIHSLKCIRAVTLTVTISSSVCLHRCFILHSYETNSNTYSALHIGTHLGRLGRGEVKPGRDKVMLRHLGPVFPVSGSRHQTSWPGSIKRKATCFQISDCFFVIFQETQIWHYLNPFDAHLALMSHNFFQVLFSTISYAEIHCIKVSLKTSQKRVLFLAENNKARLAAAVPVKLITGWQTGWKTFCAAGYKIYFAMCVCDTFI